MNMEHLKDMRQRALAHLNTCRRVRNAVVEDIDIGNKTDRLVHMDTLDLHNQLVIAEEKAVRAYAHTCAAVDAKLDQLAGITQEPRP